MMDLNEYEKTFMVSKQTTIQMKIYIDIKREIAKIHVM